MSKINWDEAQPHFEDMVSVLLSTLHPEAERIDGSGGDGGRDVQIRYPDHTDFYELKSFTGRVSKEKGRRAQIERSLKRAATHNPASWTLVVPIDHTVSELAWFDSLRAQYDFPLTWCGKTWLERELANHPRIVRYYLEGAADEAMRMLRELNKEEAGLDHGAPDALERLRRLRDRIEELDPHYRLDIRLTGDTTEIALRARYRGAELDSPIVIRGNLKFPDTELGQEVLDKYRAVFDYGESVAIPPEFIQDMHMDAPAGLGGDLGEGHLFIGPAANAEKLDINARLVVLSSDKQPLASLPLRFTEKRSGRLGGTFIGQDLTGSVTVTVRLDWSKNAGNVTFQLSPPPGQLPSPMLTVLRTAQLLKGPNLAHIEVAGVTLGEPVVLPDTDLVAAELLDLISDLDRLQTATGTTFAVPDEFTHQDQVNIRRGLQLLDGEAVEIQTDEVTTPLNTPSDALIGILREDIPRAAAADSPQMKLPVAGVQIPLGPTRFHVAAARIANRDDLLASYPWPADQPITVILRPEPGHRMQIRRLPPTSRSTESLWVRNT